MSIHSLWKFWIGIALLIVMAVTYFIPVSVDSGFNYLVQTPLLGVLIFHNAFILGLYILVCVTLIIWGMRKRTK